MTLTLNDERDAFLAVLALVIGADQQGSLRERNYLHEEVRSLSLFGDLSTDEFAKLLGEVTDRVYTTVPQQNGAFSSDGVEALLVQAKTALGPQLCQTVVQSATGLCAADGAAHGEDDLLVQIRRVLV